MSSWIKVDLVDMPGIKSCVRVSDIIAITEAPRHAKGCHILMRGTSNAVHIKQSYRDVLQQVEAFAYELPAEGDTE